MATERDKTHQPPRGTKTTHQGNTDQDEEDSEPLPNLPHEIVVQILSRLPVRSLLRFRCVCKIWLSLISDPQFVKTHLNISSKDDNYAQCSRIILYSDRSPYDLKSCSLYSAFYGPPSVNIVELDCPLKHNYYLVWVVGCCNGLLCISMGDDFFIWNPATRISKRLPSSGMILSKAYLAVHGFGYDEFTDDYKLLLVYCNVNCSESNKLKTKVYGSRTNSWRRIQDFPSVCPMDEQGIFVNQALHWVTTTRCKIPSTYTCLIFSMDLAKETYGEIPQPNYGDGDYVLTLWVSGGCLSVLCDFRGTRADVWVMKEYGVRDSWSKLVCVPYINCPMNMDTPPLYISKNGEILLVSGASLMIYNPENGTFRYLMIPNCHVYCIAETYIESLVSPSADYVG